MRSRDILKHFKYFISTSTRSMATKRGEVVAHGKGLLPISSHNSLNMCSCEVTRQIRNTISPLSQYLWSKDWYAARSFHRSICKTRQWVGKKDRMHFIFQLQKTHQQQTRQGAVLQWRALTLKVTWPIDHVIKVRPRVNFRNLYFNFYKTYDHQTW